MRSLSSQFWEQISSDIGDWVVPKAYNNLVSRASMEDLGSSINEARKKLSKLDNPPGNASKGPTGDSLGPISPEVNRKSRF